MKSQTTSTVEQLKNFIRQPYAWPGGYPQYLICADGGALCKTCATKEYKLILSDTRAVDLRSGWCIAGVDVNWEAVDLTCDHCGQLIESAYGETNEVNE